MIEIKLKKSNQLPLEQLINSYNSVGWSAYTAQPAILNQAIINSLDVITAWQNQRLIGLIRTVGDGQTILYIQDLLVAPGFQQQGIGTKLMQQVLNKLKNIRQKLLLTENETQTFSFYQKQGFIDTKEVNLVSFYREH